MRVCVAFASRSGWAVPWVVFVTAPALLPSALPSLGAVARPPGSGWTLAGLRVDGGEGEGESETARRARRVGAEPDLESRLIFSVAIPINLGKPLRPRIARKNGAKGALERG